MYQADNEKVIPVEAGRIRDSKPPLLALARVILAGCLGGRGLDSKNGTIHAQLCKEDLRPNPNDLMRCDRENYKVVVTFIAPKNRGFNRIL